MTNQDTQAAIRTQIVRLFDTAGRDATKTQLIEWERVAKEYRVDFVVQAVDYLIDNSERFPTIAHFKTALMDAKYRHQQVGREMTEKNDFTRRQERQAELENDEWWTNRFGRYASDVRALMRSTFDSAAYPKRTSNGFNGVMSSFDEKTDFATRYRMMSDFAKTVEVGEKRKERISDIIGF